MKALYNWLGKYASGPYGTYVFCLLFFIEGFFIVPVSTILAFYSLENRNKAFFYAFIGTIFSGIAALTGYYLGYLLWQSAGNKFIYYFISEKKFEFLVEQYKHYEALAVFITAFTPMPFKALTLTAGFCKIPVIPFLIYTVIARGLRFFAIATCIYIWADKVNYYLDKYFYYLVTLFFAILILTIWLIH